MVGLGLGPQDRAGEKCYEEHSGARKESYE